MTESKIAATHRLQREGRWEEASLYRDEQRRQFRGDGMNRRDAVEAAWTAMLEAFPPLEQPDQLPPGDRELEKLDEAFLSQIESSESNVLDDAKTRSQTRYAQ